MRERSLVWTTAILLLTGLLAGEGWCCNPDAATPWLVPGERQLFLDDQCIAEMTDLRRTMHQPEKRGAVIVPDRPWEISLQTRCAPAWDPDEKVFKIWLLTSTNIPDVAGTTYAESKDGVHWTKPALRQYEVEGSLENNFVALDPETGWPENAIENVVYDPDDPDPDRRYKGFLGCYDRQPIVSPDGIHWTRLDVPAIPSQDESNLSYDRRTHTFIATLKQSGPFGRSHGLSMSRDFLNWTTPELVFHADEEDQERARQNIEARLASPELAQPVHVDPESYKADIYNTPIFRYEGLYLALPAVFHTTSATPDSNDGFQLIQLACSRDLRTWKRLGDRQPFIGPSPKGKDAFDTMQLLPPSSPVVHGEELWFYYTGIRIRCRPENAKPPWGAVCLAVLRRDGFISLDAGDEPGVLTTKPFTANGADLYVNIYAPGGFLGVEALNDLGTVVAESERITGDFIQQLVTWRTGDLAYYAGQPIALRFTLRNASLYSFWFQ